jgi:phage terminase small subunit
MNRQHEEFAVAYAGHLNATRAAKEAGYSEKTAYSSGGRLLKRVEVVARVKALRDAKFRSLHMQTDELLALVAGQARGVMGKLIHVTPDGDPYVDLSKADELDLAHVTEVMIEDFTDGREIDEEGNVIKRDVRRVKVKIASPDSARSTLMKHHGLLREKLELTVDESFAAVMEAQQRKADAMKGAADE